MNTAMFRFPSAVAAFLAFCILPGPGHGAEQGSSRPDRAVEQISINRPTWHRGAGLLYGAVTVKNRNRYAVVNIIISCDLFDQWGNPLGSKGTVLRVPVPPGKTRISGIEFPITTPNMQAGACRALSAERM